MRTRSLALCFALAASPAAAQVQPELLADIETEPPFSTGPEDSDPIFLAEFGGKMLFRASDGNLTRGLWSVDPTTGDAIQLTGTNGGEPGPVVPIDASRAVFTVTTFSEGTELWVTDGTPLGTGPLVELYPGSISSVSGAPIFWQGDAWFIGNTPDEGYELWRTDGTVGGTELAHVFTPGPDGVGFPYFYVAGDKLFLSTFDNGLPELWALDDPDGSPTFLGTFYGGVGSTLVDVAVEFQGELWFAGDDGVTGNELWRSDGTVAGTVQVVDIEAGGDSNPEIMAVGVSGLWFKAFRSDTGNELWRSDGTTAGTQLVTDLVPGPEGSILVPRAAIAGNGMLIYTGAVGISNFELHVSDGTPGGTGLLLDFYGPFVSTSPGSYVEYGGLVYYRSPSPNFGSELWVTDGTLAGTSMVADIYPGNFGSNAVPFVAFNRLWVTADDGVHGQELWTSNGTAPGTSLFAELAPQPLSDGSSPGYFVKFLDRAVFQARNELIGTELYVTDGTAGGTRLVADLYPGPFGSSARPHLALGDRVLMTATTPDYGSELWSTDGTVEGTNLVLDIWPGTGGSGPGGFIALGSGALFAADTIEGDALFYTDGTAAGTQQLTTGDFDFYYDGVASGAVLNGVVFFGGESSDAEGRELWKSDGTAAGTQLVKDINPGAGDSTPNYFAVLGDSVLFSAHDGVHGDELWITDGTEAGTNLLFDVSPGSSNADPRALTNGGDFVIFRAFSTGLGIEPWVTDGTPGGTMNLLDIVPGDDYSGSSPWDFAKIGDLVYFSASDASGDGTLGYWTTDGTAAGTIHYAYGEAPGLTSSLFRDFGGDGSVVFRGSSYTTGLETWIVPASGGPAQVLYDIYPGPGSSSPYHFIELNGKLVFNGNDLIHGSEVYSVDLVDLGNFGAEPFGVGCSTSPTAASIGHSGLAGLGDVLNVEIDDAAPGTGAWAFFSLGIGALPLGSGCYLYLPSPIALGSTITDAEGHGSIAAGIPADNALVGLGLTLQYLVGDPGGPVFGQFGLSNALELVIGE